MGHRKVYLKANSAPLWLFVAQINVCNITASCDWVIVQTKCRIPDVAEYRNCKDTNLSWALLTDVVGVRLMREAKVEMKHS